MRNGATAPAENRNGMRSQFFQLIVHFVEEGNMPAVIGTDPDGVHIFLNRRASDDRCGAMITEIDDLHTASREFNVDCDDRTVVSIADGDSGENAMPRFGFPFALL